MNNEPVAWMAEIIRKDGVDDSELSFTKDFAESIARPMGAKVIPLYTHPAKTLTDEEIIEIAEKSRQWVNDSKNRLEGADCNLYGNAYNKHFARAILRKAQEK
jgi:hypothetical protein